MVTLKIGSWSPNLINWFDYHLENWVKVTKSNQIFWHKTWSLVWIHHLVQEIGCRQAIFGQNLTFKVLVWPWKRGWGHQNLITSSPHPNTVCASLAKIYPLVQEYRQEATPTLTRSAPKAICPPIPSAGGYNKTMCIILLNPKNKVTPETSTQIFSSFPVIYIPQTIYPKQYDSSPCGSRVWREWYTCISGAPPSSRINSR